MAKSEKLKQKREKQVAAAKATFEEYKDYIVQTFIETFGGSYQTAENMKDIWRDSFIFRPECERFLLRKTKMLLSSVMRSVTASFPLILLREYTGKELEEYL